MKASPTALDVLHVITTIDRGGAENHLMDVVRHQVGRGRRVGVAWLKGQYWARCLKEDLGVVVFPLRSRFYGDGFALWRLRQAIEQTRPRLIHAHMGPAELYTRVMLATVRSRPVFAVSKHNDAPIFKGPFAGAVEHWIGKRAAAIVCISEAVARRMCAPPVALPASKVKVVHYGIDPTHFRSDPARVASLRTEWKGPNPETVVFGCVARLVPQKDHDTLFRAVALIRQEMGPQAFRLVLVGRGPEEQRLRAVAKTLGIDDVVVFAGFREDIPSVMAAIDVFCLSSVHEGFGLVLIEAMVAAKPVVATRVSSIPEIVVPNETGCLVAPGDVLGFAAAMRQVFDPRLRQSLGEGGGIRVSSQFTSAAMNRKLDALYGQLLPGWTP